MRHLPPTPLLAPHSLGPKVTSHHHPRYSLTKHPPPPSPYPVDSAETLRQLQSWKSQQLIYPTSKARRRLFLPQTTCVGASFDRRRGGRGTFVINIVSTVVNIKN